MEKLPSKELSLAYWLNQHRTTVQRVGYGSLIALCSTIWLIFLWQLFGVIINYPATQRAYDTIAEPTVLYANSEHPAALQINDQAVLDGGGNTVDVYAVITNPNHFYAGTFSYQLAAGAGVPIEFTNEFIAPNSQLYVVAHPFAGANLTTSPTVTITATSWTRLRGTVPATAFVVTHSNLAPVQFVTTNTNTTNSTDKTGTKNTNTTSSASASTSVPTTQFTATVTNNSPYGFREVVAMVVLTDDSGTIFGVQRLLLHDFYSFTDQPITVTWQRRFPINVKATVTFSTNIASSDNLILPGER